MNIIVSNPAEECSYEQVYGQMPNWFGPFMMSLMNFRRDILERMNIGQVAVSQPQAYHLETDDPEDGIHSAEDSSEEETDKHHGTFTNGPLPYGANPFGQSPYTPQPAFRLTPCGPQQPFGSAPYGPQQSYGLAPYQPYGSLGPMPYGDYVPSHPKKVNHKKKKYHAHAEPEPEPYHAHETEYSHEDSSEEESDDSDEDTEEDTDKVAIANGEEPSDPKKAELYRDSVKQCSFSGPKNGPRGPPCDGSTQKCCNFGVQSWWYEN